MSHLTEIKIDIPNLFLNLQNTLKISSITNSLMHYLVNRVIFIWSFEIISFQITKEALISMDINCYYVYLVVLNRPSLKGSAFFQTPISNGVGTKNIDFVFYCDLQCMYENGWFAIIGSYISGAAQWTTNSRKYGSSGIKIFIFIQGVSLISLFYVLLRLCLSFIYSFVPSAIIISLWCVDVYNFVNRLVGLPRGQLVY